ncbi:MAG: UbiA family prenyltransferase [Euryarchaeota archaeon]|nr:UbiA family prenyltransferase [Euryarchaeota archaeon]
MSLYSNVNNNFKKLLNDVNTSLKHIVSFLEKKRLNFLQVFIIIFICSSLRMIIEASLFEYNFSIFNYAHTITFFFPVFILGVFILKVTTNEELLKIANITCIGFFFLPLAPVFDYFLLNVKAYDYMPQTAFLDLFLTSNIGIWGGLFQKIMILSLIILACIYVYVKTRMLSKAIMTFFVFWFILPIFIVPMINPLLASCESQIIFFLYFGFITLILIILIILVSQKGLLMNLIRSLRPLPMIHAVFMVLLGIIVANNLNVIDGFRFPLNDTLGLTILSCLAVLSAWSFTVLINHIYDKEIDIISGENRITTKNLLPNSYIKQLLLIFALLSVLFSFLLHYYAIIIIGFALLLGILYSVPPFRLRNKVFSPMFIGLGSFLAFFLGVVTPPYSSGVWDFKIFTPVIPLSALSIGAVIFIALSVGTVIKDLKNYEGDKKAGVKTIFTIYGMEKGTTISSILLLISFLSPLLLFHTITDFLIIFILGIFTMILFKKIKNVELVFLSYFIMGLYLLLRWLNYL